MLAADDSYEGITPRVFTTQPNDTEDRRTTVLDEFENQTPLYPEAMQAILSEAKNLVIALRQAQGERKPHGRSNERMLKVGLLVRADGFGGEFATSGFGKFFLRLNVRT
jgi:hypothetical protein